MSDKTADFRWGAEAVDLSENSLPALKARFVVGHLPDTGRVLEVGSGNGKILRTAATHRPGVELFGCDVREPTREPDGYTFRKMGRDLPFEDHSVDVVLIVDVLEHVPDPVHLIAEAARVLQAGGKLVAFIPIEGEPLSFYALYRRLLGEDLYAETKEHIQAFTHARADAILASHFDVGERRYAYHILGQLMDATFFAATRAKRLRDFWWKDNVFYNHEAKQKGGGTGALNKLLVAANAVAAVESTVWSRARLGSAGLLVEARVRRHPRERRSDGSLSEQS